MSFYTSYSPLKQMVSSNKIFTEAANLHTRSEQYLCYLLQCELWSAYSIHCFLCFPLMQIKSLYCPFADLVLHTLIIAGLIYSFLYMCIFHCHKRTHFWVKDLILFVAEGSALSCPAPALCNKWVSVEMNKFITPMKWEQQVQEVEQAWKLISRMLAGPGGNSSNERGWSKALCRTGDMVCPSPCAGGHCADAGVITQETCSLRTISWFGLEGALDII